MRNKKGNFQDILEFIKVAIIFGFGAILVVSFISSANNSIQNMNGDIISNTSKNVSTNYVSAVPKGFDYLAILGYMVFLIFSFVAARLIPSSPKFWIVGIFILIGLTLISMFLEDVANGFLTNTSLLAAVNQLTIIPFMLNNLRYFVLFYGGIVALAIYTKDE